MHAKKRILLNTLKYALGLVLLAWIAWAHWSIRDPAGNEVGLAAAFQRPVHFFPLILAILICATSNLMTFFRWYLLVRAQELPFTLSDGLRLGLIGFALNTFLPTSVGGDVMKAACMARDQTRRTVAVVTIVADRVVGLCGLFWLVALVGCLVWRTGTLEQIASTSAARATLEALLLGGAAGTILSFVFWFALSYLGRTGLEALVRRLVGLRNVGNLLGEVLQAVWLYRNRGATIALALGLSMVSHAGFVLTFYFASRSMASADEIPGVEAHFVVVPAGILIRAGFPSPGGMGATEFAFGKLYELLDSSFATAVLATLVVRALSWVLALVGYFVFWQFPVRPGIPP